MIQMPFAANNSLIIIERQRLINWNLLHEEKFNCIIEQVQAAYVRISCRESADKYITAIVCQLPFNQLSFSQRIVHAGI